MDTYTLPVFPMPPSVNEAYSSSLFYKAKAPFPIKSHAEMMRKLGSNRVLSEKAKGYKQFISNVMNEQGHTTKLRDFIQEREAIEMRIYVYRSNWYTQSGRPNCNAGDADNRVKVLQDAIMDTVGINDSCIFYSGVRKVSCDPGKEHVMVVIHEVVPEADWF